MTYSTFTKGVGSLLHMRQKHVNFEAALWLACGSVPAMLLSVFVVQYIRKQFGMTINNVIIHAIGFTLLLVALLIVIKPYLLRSIDRRNIEKQKQAALDGQGLDTSKTSKWEKRYRPMLTALVGAVVGFLVGLTSVGSGTLIIVSIAFLYPRLTPKELVGTDIFQAFLLLLSGVLGYAGTGDINWPMVGMLLLGSLPGVYLGSMASKYVPNRYLSPILAVVLVISGLKMI
ncbi:sulfite exporter TauE/SafE family protein [Ktedonosporobacter rubrisoli]|uniref:Probable membrane transporter protein n=1 Tax=Ktedonosporobacter rubrisoli TaxID=2509675 RepID=A0A4P6JSJ0_KTERU|nr:sulfite exporter TauE/SafE family protein [Ktedonosporobacter rubrisoli]QBD78210.1 sulfite exporter TauE/SafE family protein [Ktedonosporobacter rubrisoli]